MSLFMKVWNTFNKAVLKSPLHFLTSKNTLLLTCTGRKSGQPITVPVNYAQDGDTVRITSSPDRQWWRNLKATPEVLLHLRGKAAQGSAEVFEEQEAFAAELAAYLAAFPQMAKYFDVGIEDDKRFNQADLLKAAESRVMVKVILGE